MAAPTQDQVMGQLRVIIPALGTLVSAFGVSSTSVNSTVATLMTAVGPISYLISAIWSWVAHLQSSQIANVALIATGPASSVAVEAQTALISATSAIAQDKTIPKSEDAKNALVAATIALPEVQTIVTNAETAAASSSASVVSAGTARRFGT